MSPAHTEAPCCSPDHWAVLTGSDREALETAILIDLAGDAGVRLCGWPTRTQHFVARSFHEGSHGAMAHVRGQKIWDLTIERDLTWRVGTGFSAGLARIGGSEAPPARELVPLAERKTTTDARSATRWARHLAMDRVHAGLLVETGASARLAAMQQRLPCDRCGRFYGVGSHDRERCIQLRPTTPQIDDGDLRPYASAMCDWRSTLALLREFTKRAELLLRKNWRYVYALAMSLCEEYELGAEQIVASFNRQDIGPCSPWCHRLFRKSGGS